MGRLELSFGSGEDTLSVRTFSVREEMSGLFEVNIMARSSNEDIDFDATIGKPAMFRMVAGGDSALVSTRLWSGICKSLEQTRVEPDGLSTYELTIVPALWMATQRRNNRLFQHISIPDIIERLLDEWNIERVWRIARDQYPKLELRIQYGESDYDFMCRLLEEAGISFYFVDDFMKGSQLVFNDRPQSNEPRQMLPIRFVDDPKLAQAARAEFITEVRVGQEVRPGRVTIRDYDFRRPSFSLYGESPIHAGVEEKMEQYHYMPGACLVEGMKGGETPTADDKGVARFHAPTGAAIAARHLESHRATRRLVRFKTSCMDLSPGVIIAMSGHARTDLAPENHLLMKSFLIEGEVNEEWTYSGTAVSAAAPYRPAMVTQKPRIYGVQSAVVVGPPGETVYTDEFGRVRVQFHWDREGKLDDNSSIWMRVSQSWAGAGYGMINIPRVGHEVLVGFLDGDPDSPIITGRVFNGAQQVPYKLPETKLVSAWKSDSNSNIIIFVDIPGNEAFLEQAEKDRLGITKNDDTLLVGNDHARAIANDDGTLVGGKAGRAVLGASSTLVGTESSLAAKYTHAESAGLELTNVSGYKWSAGVAPVVPLILTELALGIARDKLKEAFPNGPPDLQALMAQMGGGAGRPPPPGVNVVLAIPLAAALALQQGPAGAKEALKQLMMPLAGAINGMSSDQLSQLLQGGDGGPPDLQSILQKLQQMVGQGGAGAGQAPPQGQGQAPGQAPGQGQGAPDFQALMAQLMAMFDQMMAAGPPGGAPEGGGLSKSKEKSGKEKALEAFGVFLKILGAIMDEIMPPTSIRIQPKEIRLTTGKASIILKDDKIEMKASGDITIEGGSVSITPPPCKCG